MACIVGRKTLLTHSLRHFCRHGRRQRRKDYTIPTLDLTLSVWNSIRYACYSSSASFGTTELFVILSVLIDIVLSTAHKAKGLEFDTVRLTEDYLACDASKKSSYFVLKFIGWFVVKHCLVSIIICYCKLAALHSGCVGLWPAVFPCPAPNYGWHVLGKLSAMCRTNRTQPSIPPGSVNEYQWLETNILQTGAAWPQVQRPCVCVWAWVSA